MEVHANMISGMIDGTIKQRPPYVRAAEFLLLLIRDWPWHCCCRCWGRSSRRDHDRGPARGAGHQHVCSITQPGPAAASGFVLILLLFMLNMAYGFFIEARGFAADCRIFGQYVPPELVEEMAKNPERFNMRRARELSVFFSDVRGFTTISESLSPRIYRLHQRVPHHHEPGDS